MKTENLKKANEIVATIGRINSNLEDLNRQLEMLEDPKLLNKKVMCQLIADGYNSRSSKVDKLSYLDFVNSQIAKDQREIKQLEKEFDNL